jgi:hypothetical protein
MALRLLQPGTQPLGQFDGYDADLTVTGLKGGEVVTLVGYPLTGTDKAASDVFDGYTNTGSQEKRVVVTKNLPVGAKLLMLADEGTSDYGTILGYVVGGTAGQSVSGGAVLGPHTATGSGKVTCWDKPGLYAVSLDACDTNASTGLQPTNTTLASGDLLYATSSGLITPNASLSFAGAGQKPIGQFVSFETNGSLVNTPSKLAQALNSPSGSSAVAKSFKWAVFHFNP